ncbi:MAG: hypothetical protein OET90_05695 [Desulfuromonadales bacterium]|nr:hypothetical protein [Desulfuromonadales bacterium]
MSVIYIIPIYFLLSYFFWGRGILKSAHDDLCLGFGLYVATILYTFAMMGGSYATSFSFIFMVLFGLLTFSLRMKYKEPEKAYFTYSRITLYGAISLVFGALFSIVV